MNTDFRKLFSKHFPDHGHWKGVDGGTTVLVWLMYILSEADHRLSHVEDWCEEHLETLRAIIGNKELRTLDLSDDRLGRLLDALGKDNKWDDLEKDLSSQLVKVYELSAIKNKSDFSDLVRLDSFNVPQHRAESDFFKRGYSKQRRPEWPFYKTMMATYEKGDIPLSLNILAGNDSDDPNYLPVIKKVKKILKGEGRLFVADSKIGSNKNRSAIAALNDYYLCPLNGKQCTKEQLIEYVDQSPETSKLPSIHKENKNRSTTYYYELPNKIKMIDKIDKSYSWEERRVLSYSVGHAADLNKGLDIRLDRAEQELKNVLVRKSGRKIIRTEEALKIKVSKVLQKHFVENLFSIRYTEISESAAKAKVKNRRKPGINIELEISRNEAAIKKVRNRYGWAIYGSNLPQSVGAKRIVEIYHDQYKIEHVFDRLINYATKLLPVYLKKENRIKGLTRLVAVAIQFSMLIQHKVREKVEQLNVKLKGLYPGSKNRVAEMPTTQLLLRSFKNIAVVINDHDGKRNVQMPELKAIQEEILDLLGCKNLYQLFIKRMEST